MYTGCPSEERQGIIKTITSMIKHYLVAIVLSAGVGLGCQSIGKKKPGENYSLIALYIEQNNDGTKYSKKMAVYRADPIIFYVNSEPFLDTADLEQATLMEAIGGFAIQFSSTATAPLYSIVSPPRTKAGEWPSSASSQNHESSPPQ
ncbi:MAG: hypothetical protein Ct9H300mP7_2570 [Verrucomicrobiota bacterium]|nr:MAG: hypothetical protein Ct9H300mP7_2570 [Verrucomicrobiota bacterium]